MPDFDEPSQRPFNIDDQGQNFPLEKLTGSRRRPAPVHQLHERSGRVPPQAMDVEQSVLGAMLLEREAIPKVIEVLADDAFYQAKHQHIYAAALRLFERGTPVDLITLTDELRRAGTLDEVGGAYYLTELTSRVDTAANVEYHARIIAEKSLLRKMIETMTGLIGKAYDAGADAFELLDQVERDIFNISDSQLRKAAVSMRDVVIETVERLQSIHGQVGGITGVASGFHRLDGMTSGWQPSDLVIIAARPSMGKCLGLGTPVMMHDGTIKAVEDVRVGDLLMGDDSAPRRVLTLARGRERMVWVRQTYGMDYRVNESHILSVKKSRSGGAEPRGAVTDIAVRDYLARSPKWQNDHKGYKVAVDFPEQPVPLDPYLLGLWLGDGKSDNARIYTQDAEIVEYLEAVAEERGEHVSVSDADRCPAYLVTSGYRGYREDGGVETVQGILRTLGVLGDKHIPHLYLANSREYRLRLLAGLVDSDGHRNAGHGGTFEITQTSRRLAEQIKHLCDTLGYRTSLREKTARITSIGYEGTVYRVRFNGDVDAIPTRLARKQAPPWKDFRDWRVSGIRLEDDGVGDYYGFEIDGNRRFLLGDGTVTHNTAFSLSLARNAAMHPTDPVGVAIFSLEMSAQQLAQRLLTSEARVDAQAARTGNMTDDDWSKLARAAGRLAEAPIYIDDTPGLSILELRAKCRRLKAEHNIGFVVVDYLQLMHGTAATKGQNREQEIAQISRSLKSLAKELNVPVIALAQLSRAVETRGGDKRPQLSDLRESGCLTGDTLVTRADTGARVPIRDLVALYPDGGFPVWALDTATMKLEAAPVSRAFSTGTKPVYRITTQLGETIRATANHKFLTADGWKRLDELGARDRLALPRELAQPAEPSRSLDELALLGHLIGDGCTLPRHAIQYTTRESDLAETVSDLAERVFAGEVAPRIKREHDRKRGRSWIQVYLASTRQHTHGVRSAVSEWLEELGVWGLRSHEKFVPAVVFEQPAVHMAHFLRHLWATDGCVRMRGGKKPYPAVYYASSSGRLARDVQALLLRVGVRSRVKLIPQGEKGRDQYHTVVSGQPDLMKFAEVVGAVGLYKQGALAEIEAYLADHDANTNRDVIPGSVWEGLVKPAMERAEMTTRQMQAGIGMSYCGSTLYRSNLSRARAARVAAVVGSLRLARLAESDVYWDAIASIELDGVEEVFDLTVPGLHNFVADDIVVHNSIEQDADVVGFIYRAERYGITVDENGNSTEGMAEVIIGKQRNGPIGSVSLAFINRYARFENLTTHYADPNGGFGGEDYGAPGLDPGFDAGQSGDGYDALPPAPPADGDYPF